MADFYYRLIPFNVGHPIYNYSHFDQKSNRSTVILIHDFRDGNKSALLYGELCCNSYSNWNQTILQTHCRSLATFSSNCRQEVKVFQVARSMMQSIISENQLIGNLVKRIAIYKGFPCSHENWSFHGCSQFETIKLLEKATHFIRSSSAFKVWTPSLPFSRVPKRTILSGTKASPCSILVILIKLKGKTHAFPRMHARNKSKY